MRRTQSSAGCLVAIVLAWASELRAQEDPPHAATNEAEPPATVLTEHDGDFAAGYSGWRRYDPFSYLDWTLARAGRASSEAVLWFSDTVMDQRDFHFEVHASHRLRGERVSHDDFSGAMRDNVALFYDRTIIDTRWRVRDFVTARAQVIDARAWGERRRDRAVTPERDLWDLWEGFIDINQFDDYYFPFILRGGRFRVELGDERMIGSDDFAQIPQSFDGGEALFITPEWKALGLPKGFLQGELFAIYPVQVDHRNANQPINDVDLMGLFATLQNLAEAPDEASYLRRLAAKSQWDLFYFLERDKDNVIIAENGHQGDMDRNSYGLEWRFPLPGTLRGRGFWAYQNGSRAGDHIRATAYAASITAPFREIALDHPAVPELSLAYDHATGDSDPEDGTLGSFHQPAGVNHGRFGYSDLVGFSNLRHLGATANWRFDEALGGQAGYHWLRQDTDHDVVGNLAGRPARQNTSSRGARNIGIGMDAVIFWQYLPHIEVETGYAYFRPSFSGSAADHVIRRQHRFWLSLGVSF